MHVRDRAAVDFRIAGLRIMYEGLSLHQEDARANLELASLSSFRRRVPTTLGKNDWAVPEVADIVGSAAAHLHLGSSYGHAIGNQTTQVGRLEAT